MKTNVAELLIPNQLLKCHVKALGMEFEFAEFLEKSSDWMKKLFSNQSTFRIEDNEKFQEELREFIRQFKDKMEELNVDENLRTILLENMVCFGPDGYGPNILCIPKINKKYLLSDRLLNEVKIESKGNCL